VARRSCGFAWLDEPLSATSFGEAVDDALARVIDRPYLSDLWIHELRYLPDAQARTLRRRMRRWHQGAGATLRQERPGLDEGQGELLTWACLSLMSCVGRRAIHAPQSVRLPVVRAGIHALTRVKLPPTGAETVATQTGMLPVSRRERLLLAAIEQFGRNGYHDTSMASIGAAADVTGPNLYSYFASKADLLQAVYERGTHALWLSLDEALMTAASPNEALTAVVRSFVGIARTWLAILDDPTVESGLADAALGAQRSTWANGALWWRAACRTSMREWHGCACNSAYSSSPTSTGTPGSLAVSPSRKACRHWSSRCCATGNDLRRIPSAPASERIGPRGPALPRSPAQAATDGAAAAALRYLDQDVLSDAVGVSNARATVAPWTGTNLPAPQVGHRADGAGEHPVRGLRRA
jgi:AcrR family transcriptional regulator